MSDLLIGIDVGTSSCKVAVFDADGIAMAQESRDYPVHYPKPGWAEQNPDDWWYAICTAVQDLLKKSEINPKRIAGVGIAGQSWSAIPIDKHGNCLCPTPIWMDTRSADICMELSGKIGADNIFRISGNPLEPTYTLPKILWYKRELPEVYANAVKILSSNGYIAFRLTGETSQDICQAYGYANFNMERGNWDEALGREIGLRRDLLCELMPCHEIIGSVTKDAALRCGLAEGTPVVAGGLDAACGTLGAGVLHNGQTQEQGGQAGGMSICTDSYHAEPSLILSRHVVPDRWLLQGGTVGGGGVIKWLGGELWPDKSFSELSLRAEKAAPGSDGLVFLPYMAGERSPIWDAHAKGIYYGLDYSKKDSHIIRASMEGVAFSLRHNIEVASAAGAEVGRLSAMGGASNSLIWTQIKSDITGKPIDVPSSDTATTLGAAMLAGVAAGVFRDFDDAVSRTVKTTRSHEPNMSNKNVYDKNYKIYLELYERLKSLMQED